MKRVKKKGCTLFTAHIQENRSLFLKSRVGNPWVLWKIENYINRPHRLMEADLEQVPEDF
jgi:hypothetical protein